MEIKSREVSASGTKFYMEFEGKEVGRAYIYFLNNDLHEQPFGLLEDVFVQDEHRGNGYGPRLVEAIIEEARERGCYKLICTSRHSKPKVHGMYANLGFRNHGLEFRIDF